MQMNNPYYLYAKSMTDLYDEVYKPKTPVIENLLYSGTYLFVGAPKVGKAFFMAQIAYHISKGRRFCPLGAAPHDIADERILLIDVHQMIAVLDWAQALDLNAPAIDHLDPRIRRQAYCKGQRQGEKNAYRFFHGHSSLSKLFFLLRFILHESGAKVK